MEADEFAKLRARVDGDGEAGGVRVAIKEKKEIK